MIYVIIGLAGLRAVVGVALVIGDAGVVGVSEGLSEWEFYRARYPLACWITTDFAEVAEIGDAGGVGVGKSSGRWSVGREEDWKDGNEESWKMLFRAAL